MQNTNIYTHIYLMRSLNSMKDKANKYIYNIYLLNAHIIINIYNYLDNFRHIPHDSNVCLYVHKLQLLIEKYIAKNYTNIQIYVRLFIISFFSLYVV